MDEIDIVAAINQLCEWGIIETVDEYEDGVVFELSDAHLAEFPEGNLEERVAQFLAKYNCDAVGLQVVANESTGIYTVFIPYTKIEEKTEKKGKGFEPDTSEYFEKDE